MKTDDALSALRALAQEHRLAVFRLLVEIGPGGTPVGELGKRLGLPSATLSAHLNLLRHAQLVLDERQGRVIRVSANFAKMAELMAYLSENCCAGAACELPVAVQETKLESPRGQC